MEGVVNMINFDISIIDNRLEFELNSNGKWYAINKEKNIRLEIKDKDISRLLSDSLNFEAEKDDLIELLIVTMLTKLERRM